MRNRNWITPAMSVVALLMTAGSAYAQQLSWSNFYVSIFGGGAAGNGSVAASGYDPECGVDPEWCLYEMEGEVGTGITGGVAAGVMFSENLRGEVELSFASLGTDTETFSYGIDSPPSLIENATHSDSLLATFLFGNIWYDIPVAEQFSAYVGAGVGLAHATGTFSAPITSPYPSDLSLDVDGVAPAVQIGAGVNYALASGVTLDFGYRFKQAFGLDVSPASTFSPTLQDTSYDDSMNLGVHAFQVGVSFAIN